MKAISIKEPWASLIAHDIKDIENRTWKTNFRGTVLIHTSQAWNKESAEICISNPNVKASLEKLGMIHKYDIDTIGYKGYSFSGLSHGAIIGKVDIVECVINHSSIWAEKSHANHSGFFDLSRNKPIYNWVLENAILFPEPILGVKGKLSIWDYPNITSDPEEDNGKLYCHCQIPVKGENQVWEMHEKYICKYCDGIWYK